MPNGRIPKSDPARTLLATRTQTYHIHSKFFFKGVRAVPPSESPSFLYRSNFHPETRSVLPFV